MTLIDLHITGKALFFNSVQQRELHNDFQQVPGNLTLAQSVEVFKAKNCR